MSQQKSTQFPPIQKISLIPATYSKDRSSVQTLQARQKTKEMIQREQIKLPQVTPASKKTNLKGDSQRISTVSPPLPDLRDVLLFKQYPSNNNNNVQINQHPNPIFQSETLRKEEEENKDNIVEVTNLTSTIKSQSNVSQLFKYLKSMLQGNCVKVNLTIYYELTDEEEYFSSEKRDKEILRFCKSLGRFASRINNLTWEMKKKYYFSGNSFRIGDVIGQCTSAFSIRLNLENIFISSDEEDCLASVASGISNLQNLKILVLQANLSSLGMFRINKAIQGLKRLQKVDFYYLDWKYLPITPFLGNFYYQIESMERSTRTDRSRLPPSYQANKHYEQFKEKIQPLQKQLTELSISFREFNLDGNQNDFTESLRFDVYIPFLQYAICYAIQNIPYITYFSDGLGDSNNIEGQQPIDLPPYRRGYPQLKTIIQDLVLLKRRMILMTLIYNKYIALQLPLNPKVIITDLFFD